MCISQSYALSPEASRLQRIDDIDAQVAQTFDLLHSLQAERRLISETLGAAVVAPIANLTLLPDVAQTA